MSRRRERLERDRRHAEIWEWIRQREHELYLEEHPEVRAEAAVRAQAPVPLLIPGRVGDFDTQAFLDQLPSTPSAVLPRGPHGELPYVHQTTAPDRPWDPGGPQHVDRIELRDGAGRLIQVIEGEVKSRYASS